MVPKSRNRAVSIQVTYTDLLLSLFVLSCLVVLSVLDIVERLSSMAYIMNLIDVT
jgi:hypothetical protein